VIVYSPVRSYVGTDIQFSAKIELQNKRKGGSSHLWFRFPAAMESQLSGDIDPFVVALLLVAMQNGESMEVRGPLSNQLFQGLQSYQEIYHVWYPDRFHMIAILPTALRDDAVSSHRNEGCAFSGGVDSFFTLLELIKKQSEESDSPRLTHALFMAGFDMPLHLGSSIEELTRSYSQMMKDLTLQFVVGSTNVRQFVNTVDWTNAHGQALAASALFLKNTLYKFNIPASYTADSYPKWGTHPQLDHHLSTESMHMVHHGAHANRVRKLETISLSIESYDRLRVCWIQDIGLKNCGQCEKCVRTMVALDLLKALPRYVTFGSANLDRRQVRQLKQRTYQGRLFARELMREAMRRRRPKIWFDLAFSLVRRTIRFHAAKIVNLS
jgi:hypothetical protein